MQGVFETSNEFYNSDYMAYFMSTFGISFPFQDYVVTDGSGNYGFNCNSYVGSVYIDCTESMLDIEYMMALSQNSKTVFYEQLFETNGQNSVAANFAYTFDDWMMAVSNDTNNVKVYSISYVLFTHINFCI